MALFPTNYHEIEGPHPPKMPAQVPTVEQLDQALAQVSKPREVSPMVFCFTFGLGSPLARYYVEIEAPDELTARLHMNCLFTQHWASVYPREGFDPQIACYKLTRLDVNLEASVRLGTNHDEVPTDQYARVYLHTMTNR